MLSMIVLLSCILKGAYASYTADNVDSMATKKIKYKKNAIILFFYYKKHQHQLQLIVQRLR